MPCCVNKGKQANRDNLVRCETCGMKIARDVAAVMYLKGEEHIFCSFECQDRWEEKHPAELW